MVSVIVPVLDEEGYLERAGALRAAVEAARILATRSLTGRVPRSKTFFTPVR